MANQNKIQICLDDDVYAIIRNLKSRSLKLFVSVAIERLASAGFLLFSRVETRGPGLTVPGGVRFLGAVGTSEHLLR